LLLFDEVITGYRLAYGGAVEWYGVSPDLWCFGKVIGGGLPMGAFAGPAEIMSHLAPLGPVYQAGTLSGNPLATAAGLAALSELGRSAYRELEASAESLASGLEEAIGSAGVEVQVPRVGPLVGLFFTDRPVRNFDDAREACENGRYRVFFHEMLRQGIALAPGPYEAIFPSLAHEAEHFERTIEAAQIAARAVLAAYA
jgi:glutamate-1-semialdehyde 2,1-aminomutase